MTPGDRKLGPASCKLQICQAVPPHMRSGVREITHLHVEPEMRRKGYAKALLMDLAAEADERHIVLVLIVQPFDEDGYADMDLLIELYESVGFSIIQSEPAVMMARQWQAKQARVMLADAIGRVLH